MHGCLVVIKGSAGGGKRYMLYIDMFILDSDTAEYLNIPVFISRDIIVTCADLEFFVRGGPTQTQEDRPA